MVPELYITKILSGIFIFIYLSLLSLQGQLGMEMHIIKIQYKLFNGTQKLR